MNIIFLGGLSRSGKAAFWPLFSSLEHTDQPQNIADLDWYNTAYSNDQIEEKFFLELLKTKINMSSWFSYLGRYLNTNSNDWTNFTRLRSQEEYNSRIFREDSEKVFSEYQSKIASKKFIPVFNTNIRLSQEQQNYVGFEISYLHILRNPFRMYNEWIKTNRILRKRMSNSRIMDLKRIDSSLTVENETADLIIQDNLHSRNSKSLIKFEKYCMDPEKTMSYIAKICNLKLLPFQKEKLQDANVPRDISGEFNLSLLNSNNLSNDRLETLYNLQEEFLKDVS